ncbi:cryptochrome/photolyase family protein [Amnibacterium kyonggiense]|uniref:Deoxyribodipyrimidine photo-lyase n=1 Tax=Amnibacterium kyonggiense TaxID=595671 RepID=A0A4R7FPI8_9MICO|nr:deoxyribodipyrimidine photo-lyase [Amnibacterium kyonggiense]TDS79665.1 deoxyribodipyrimidine photo-lyase type I [Amnibacterium kyonggiense]
MTSSDAPAVVWFRDDLRVSDNPALRAAVDSGRPVLPVYVLDDSGGGSRALGGASRWWLHHSLAALDASLRKRGSRLVLRHGDGAAEVEAVLRRTGAGLLAMNRRYSHGEQEEDHRVRRAAEGLGVEVSEHTGSLLHEPGEVLNGSGERFAVFTPFFRALTAAGQPREPLPAPASIDGWEGSVHTEDLDALGLLPTHPDWAGGLGEEWTPGEKGAHRRVDDFVAHRLARYADERDLPAAEASSRLSPHLKFGEISPYQLWHRVQNADAPADIRTKFLTELGWREFDYDLLESHPHLDTVNVHREFDAFPWADVDDRVLHAWQRGRTGIPLVDAGMRQLWTTGWMHNRVRMVVASFLVKNLRYDWRLGEQWFWDTLVDADPANNTAQWQWVAGSGADAAPFFRVFNPVLQSQKFDPAGEYIARWVPELADLDAKGRHEPWTVDGVDYPAPIVDLKRSRQEALDAYQRMRD